jgi:hypothetical protein
MAFLRGRATHLANVVSHARLGSIDEVISFRQDPDFECVLTAKVLISL